MQSKIYALFLLFLLLIGINDTTKAQVSAYPFTQLNTAYTPITGGQVLGTTTSDDQSYVDPASPTGATGATTGIGFPIGFNFTYNGRVYDRFGVNTNGFIALGQSSLTPAVNIVSSYTPISSTNTATTPLQNRIAGFARDLLAGASSSIRYQTIGTAPNRILVVQWSNYGRWPTTAGDDFNFQIRLLETGNIVQVVYGTCAATSTTSMTIQVGLRGDLNTDFNNRNTTTNWSATTAGVANTATCTASNSIMPPSGLTFQWGLLLSDDAGISGIVNPAFPLVPGLQPVQVTLENFGGNAINTVNIEWTANGVPQTTFPFTGPLLAGATTPVNLGNYNFPATPTLCRFWTSQPNGASDPVNSNDTFEITFCQSLAAGTYTVGTPSSDFPTIQEMLTTLYSCGITGPVTMNIQAGTYTGAVRFNGQIPGASSVNTVTINGAGQGVTVLTHNAGGVNGNATVAFDGVSYLTVQNLTIRNTANNLAWGALFINNARFNRLLDNTIEMFYSPGIAGVYGVAFQGSYGATGTEGNNGSYNLVQGNTISGGDMGMRIEGLPAGPNKGNRFINNTINNVDAYGIYADDQDSIDITGNSISNLLSATNYGMYLTDFSSFDISSNNVIAGSYGIYGLNFGTNAPVTRQNKIVNNMIRFDETYGLYISGSQTIDIYHNSILGIGNSTTSVSCYLLTPNDLDIRNNIFVNETGYVFRNGSTIAFANMNYNLFYQVVPNTNFISFGITNYSDFAQWQTNTFGHGVNDVYGDPVFFSNDDLHLDGNVANNVGDNTVGVLTDIDAETRPFTGSTNVDMGADEYTPKNDDCGVINLVSPSAPLLSGFQAVTVTVKNFAVQPLTIFTVQWKFNGIQQSNFTYTGAPVGPQQTVDINLGSINFPVGISANLEFWTVAPNNRPDERTNNDTLNRFLCPGIIGNFTLGTPNSSFPTFADAINTLYECGVSGPVVITVQPGTYVGQQLALSGNIPGSNNISRITFQGVDPAQVILTHDGSGNKIPTVSLDNVRFITIKDLTINTTAQTGSRGHGIQLTNQANENQILGNTFNATWTAAIADLISIVVSASPSDDFAEGTNASNLLIEGNTINGGEMGIHIEGDLTLSNKNIDIIDNTITGYDDYGIYADKIDTLNIVGNTITSLSGSTIAAGITLYEPVSFIVEKNVIQTRDYGIFLSDGNNPFGARRGRVVNNMVTTTDDDAFYCTTTGSTDIWHNTFANRAATTSGANGANILSPVAGTLDFRNNIFYAGSTSTTSYAFQMSINTNQLDMDNNVYFSGGPNTIRYGTTNYTFTNWRNTNTFIYDQNSLGVNPLFVSLANGNLHIQNAALNAAADSTVNVFEDIDLEVRPSLGTTRPDIGADEILLVNNDAIAIGILNPANGSCENDSTLVDVVVGNNGTAPLSAVNVTVNVTGPISATLTGSYSGNLLTGQTANVNVGTINTTGGGQFCFEIITQMVGDGNPTNDTLIVCRNIAPAIPVISATNACLNQPAVLTTVPPGGIAWYDVPAGGVALSTADTFITSPIVFTTNFYAEVVACGTTRYPVTVGVIIPTPITIGNDTTFCPGTSVDLTAPSNNITAYFWNTGDTSRTISVITPGTYTVTVVDANGCRKTDSKDVLQFQDLTATAFTSTLPCGNSGTGIIDITVTSGTTPYAFLWGNGVTSNILSGLNTGIYEVTIIDGNNCEYTELYSVNGPTSISFNAINTSSASCGQQNDGIIDIDVTGGVGPYTFVWNTGVSTEDLVGLTNGNYAVTVTDATGCQTNINTTLNVVSTVSVTVVNVVDESVQLGGSITVSASGGQAPYFILWNTGQTTATINGLVAGNYTVTVTDINGCSNVQSATVNYSIPSLTEEIESLKSVKVYPNPTANFVNISLSLTEMETIRLDIYNSTGQLLQSFDGQNATEQNYVVDLSAYSAGFYMARIMVGEKILTTKIVLEK